MIHLSKRLFTFAIVSFLSMTFAYANPPLKEALEQQKPVAIFNVNDAFTDADSIQAFIESLLLGSSYKDLITQYFVTDDEANMETHLQVVAGIQAKTCLKEEKDAKVRNHYQTANIIPKSPFGFRAQDAATVLYPLADKLGVKITLIQGEFSTNPTYNPYLGNFGVDYGDDDLQHIARIHKDTGSRAVIDAMRKEQAQGKLIYILNGGSFRLLSDIQVMDPDLLPDLDATVMAFRQPMNFAPFNDPTRIWAPSWNEGIDKGSTKIFLGYASNSKNKQLGALRIVDSNTVEYAMVCDGMMHPFYKDYMLKLKSYLSAAAYQNLLQAEERHEIWSGYKTKFSDPLVVFDAFGRASITKVEGVLARNDFDNYIRPNQMNGLRASYPAINEEHPYSHPRNLQGSEYAEQVKRVAILRGQLKAAHQETWGLLAQ